MSYPMSYIKFSHSVSVWNNETTDFSSYKVQHQEVKQLAV